MKRLSTILAAALLFAVLLSSVSFAGKLPVDGYEFPDDWSRDALVFAVENGILQGNRHHDLKPQDNITRAEMAAVLVRLLGASEPSDLSAFRDVPSGAWYSDELSCAVRAGIFSGVSSTRMEPDAPITREQAVTVLCRTFGIVSENRETYLVFSDSGSISDYARDCVSAMKELGAVQGYGDGTFRPKAPITRAETPQILYNYLDAIADSPEELPASGRVLYRGSAALPETLALDGTLILGAAMPAALTVGSWSVTGDLVLHTGADTAAELNGLTARRLVCAAVSGSVSANVQSVWLWGGGMTYNGSPEALTVMGGVHTANGSCTAADVRGGALTLNGNTGKAALAARTTLTLNGNAEEAALNGRRCTLDGSGHVGTVLVDGQDCTVSVSYDTLRDLIAERYKQEHDSALSVVQTMRVPCSARYDTALYANKNLTGYIRSLPEDTIVYNEWYPAGNAMFVSCSDGKSGWVDRWDFYISESRTTDGTLDYSDAVKEGFVDLRHYDSETEYLVWCSRYTQKVIVLQGRKDHWKVIRTFPCSTGSNFTPTPVGTYSIYARTWRWEFDYYYVNRVSIFNGGHAFHTILFDYDGDIYDGRVGIPLSHGCVRMRPADCQYIYELPMGTRVVIY